MAKHEKQTINIIFFLFLHLINYGPVLRIDISTQVTMQQQQKPHIKRVKKNRERKKENKKKIYSQTHTQIQTAQTSITRLAEVDRKNSFAMECE